MDQHLKERLVGAAVLVLIGVLVIPVLLDGPPPDEPVRVGLELPAAGDERKSHTIRLDVPAERPATPGSGSIVRPDQPSATQKQDAPEPPAPAIRPKSDATAVSTAKTEKPASKPTEPPAPEEGKRSTPAESPPAEPGAFSDPARSGGWVVQIGSFSSEENASRLSDELRGSGYPVFVSRVTAGGKAMHRVRVGPVPEKGEAETLAERLKASGHAGRVMANGD
jgi:cell division septation protein DedD